MHPKTLKKFATSLFFISWAFTLLCLKHYPVQSTTHSEYNTIYEGVFQFNELREHLHRYGAQAIVSIGEDATRVIGRVEYDKEIERCGEFVLPLDDNSFPMVNLNFSQLLRICLDRTL